MTGWGAFLAGIGGGLLIFGMIVLGLALAGGFRSQPAPAPTVFCPSGQHVTGISASGWPVCAPNR
jgi:hypothetical protein